MIRLTDRPAMTIAVDLGRKPTKQTFNQDGQEHVQTLCCVPTAERSVTKAIRTCSRLWDFFEILGLDTK